MLPCQVNSSRSLVDQKKSGPIWTDQIFSKTLVPDNRTRTNKILKISAEIIRSFEFFYPLPILFILPSRSLCRQEKALGTEEKDHLLYMIYSISHIDNTSITIKREHFYWSESFDFTFYTFLVCKTLYRKYHEMTQKSCEVFFMLFYNIRNIGVVCLTVFTYIGRSHSPVVTYVPRVTSGRVVLSVSLGNSS